MLPMSQLLDKAAQGGYAVPSFCVWNAETILTVLRVAEKLKAPVILMNGYDEFKLLPPAEINQIVLALAKQFTVPFALHLDHGRSLEAVRQCLDAGYTSVMLDFSARPFAENAEALRQVVEMARPLGVTVEGELGHVGKADNVTTEGGATSTLTEPGEAASFVDQTGVDALAVSIGNAHGEYTQLPKLDFHRLEEIRSAVSVPLVLHGGSGTPAEDLQRVISIGIAKVNVATELITTVRRSLMAQWSEGENNWTPRAMAKAMTEMAPVVEKWICRTGAAGKAS
ncbi:MAG: class II fructose-bisphosphate aldolase [Planctomycetes bacterium]|nr:class II fructose-bisphosphate aldolase [Planctomycetota bacterium]